MFGIGPSELFVVAAIALMLFSPRELPKMLRSVMKFWGSIKRTADDFKDTIMQEEAMQELRDAYDGTKSVMKKAENDARRELMKARTEVRKAQGKLAKATKIRELTSKTVDGGPGTAELPKRPPAPTSDPADDGDGPVAASTPVQAHEASRAASEPPAPELSTQSDDAAKPSDSAANQGAA